MSNELLTSQHSQECLFVCSAADGHGQITCSHLGVGACRPLQYNLLGSLGILVTVYLAEIYHWQLPTRAAVRIC
ncbi:hypothetical protein E2C01_033339 [Portunus trituberculatus]|uniref:Uncharacterized protein n=1 Tax=Portunus trituberculatus TaxID=210409 RepID=A0A5B7EXL7_PORTR|nr:hypothetical protein [Portunus trituberculatus]